MLPRPPSRLRSLLFHLRRPLAARGFPPSLDDDLRREIETRFAAILRPYELSAAVFQRFKRECGYADSYVGYMGPELLDEKLLEHFVSVELLRPQSGEVSIDIGSAQSPFFNWVAKTFGCESYQLDLAYEPGVHGNKIGASADAMPFEAPAVDVMTLHCSIDHFEGQSDSGFVREAARVLKPGGRVCILPVYFAAEPTNIVDPKHFAPRATIDPMARVRSVEGYNNRFGRFYSPETFQRRILDAAVGLNAELYRIGGERERIPKVYLDYALLLRKP
jgi:hypothetical protein